MYTPSVVLSVGPQQTPPPMQATKATTDAGRDAHHSGVGGLQRLLLSFERRGILREILQRHRRRVQLARELTHVLRCAFAQQLG